MSGTVITIVGNTLDSAVEKRALQLIRGTGADGLWVETLHPGHAIDILVKAYKPGLTTLIRQQLVALGAFDVFVQPSDSDRKKKLLIADMDATMIQQETLDELAGHFNLKDKIAPITEQAMRGEIDFGASLRMRVQLLKGLPQAALFETLKSIRYSPGADILIRTMNRQGAKSVLVSGGFDLFTNHVAATLGFHKNFGNRLIVAEHKLTGEVASPILDKYVKERLVVEQAQAFDCTLAQVIAIGDGANDIPMLKKAGIGVGYFGKPSVLEATPHQIRHTDLKSVLYMQGYRQDEIAA
ncbi:MAG: phosphoserine phosphatase SerB [Proteobacteria bacterium]|nr:phosphoserine phosphatase SerB [Pseudomonadota bacterium]